MTAAAYALAWAGVAVTVAAAVRLLATGRVFTRLHFVGPGTAVAAPLVVAGLALAPGVWGSFHDVLKIVLIGVLVFGSGPAAVVATARAAYGPAAPDESGPEGAGEGDRDG
ncbi:monovalent cation/H(+) antiporter subunit G [Actinomadura yumaensis]|uniref:Monovalent cation/H(+) antiporter subunit G n=1 Tax=Actinomadura yumaensis TaxID=111807 RepID=A0ABW2CY96_9ACTN